MKSRFAYCVVLGLCTVSSAAQQLPTPAQAGTVAVTQADADANRSNVLRYGLNLSTNFDDNAEYGETGQSNIIQSIAPKLEVNVVRDRMTTNLAYSPEYMYSSNVNFYNSVSQATSAVFDYKLTRRLTLNFRNQFRLTNNPLSAGADFNGPQLFGILDRPNPSAASLDLHTQTEEASGGFSYRLARHTDFTIAANYSGLRYGTPANSTVLTQPTQDSNAVGGSAVISHRFTRGYTSGVQYEIHNIDAQQRFGTSVQRSSILVNQFLWFHDVWLTPSLSISVFAGPELVRINSLLSPGLMPTQGNGLLSSWAGGSTLNWQKQHSGISASFVHEISDGGVFGGTVEMEAATLALKRELSTRSSISLSSNYVSNGSAANLNFGLLGDYVSGGATYSRNLSPHLNVSMSYVAQRALGGTSLWQQLGNHNRAFLGLSYEFERPVGR